VASLICAARFPCVAHMRCCRTQKCNVAVGAPDHGRSDLGYGGRAARRLSCYSSAVEAQETALFVKTSPWCGYDRWMEPPWIFLGVHSVRRAEAGLFLLIM